MAEMRRSIIFALIMASPGLVAAVLLSEREYNWTEVQQAEVDAVNFLQALPHDDYGANATTHVIKCFREEEHTTSIFNHVVRFLYIAISLAVHRTLQALCTLLLAISDLAQRMLLRLR